MMKCFLVFVVSAVCFGCASGSLLLTSTPDKAKLYIKALTGDYVELGESPVSKPISEIKNLVGGENAILIEARLDKYLVQSILVADIDSATDIKLNLALQSVEKFASELKTQEKQKSEEELEKDKLFESEREAERLVKMNKLIDQLFEAQRLVKVGQIPEASKKLDEMQSENPNLAVIYELKGGIAYMARDFNKALDNYTMAVKFYPYNIEVINMKKYLEKVLGVERNTTSLNENSNERLPANMDPSGVVTELPPAAGGQ